MNWYKIAFGPGNMTSDNEEMTRNYPDVWDDAVSDKPKINRIPSPWPKPGKPGARPGKRRPRKSRRPPALELLQRWKGQSPDPNLEQGYKRPTDGTGWPRPSGLGND